MVRYGMVIDLRRCIGCYSCVAACKAENGIPPDIFISDVIHKEVGRYPDARRVYLPILCNQCKNAPCVDVCPTNATKKREDGIVVVDKTKCIGCRYCIVACPYGRRLFMDKLKGYFEKHLTPFEEYKFKQFQYRDKIVIKCEFCKHIIDEGVKKGLKPGVDPGATPVCVITCPAHARFFGDLEDPTSEVSLLIAKRAGKPLLPEFGTDPSVYYLE